MLLVAAPVAILASPMLLPNGESVRLLAVLAVPQVFCYAMVASATAVMYAKRRYLLAAAAPHSRTSASSPSCVLAGALYAQPADGSVPTGAVLLIGGGSTLAVVMHAGVQWWGARRCGVTLAAAGRVARPGRPTHRPSRGPVDGPGRTARCADPAAAGRRRSGGRRHGGPADVAELLPPATGHRGGTGGARAVAEVVPDDRGGSGDGVRRRLPARSRAGAVPGDSGRRRLRRARGAPGQHSWQRDRCPVPPASRWSPDRWSRWRSGSRARRCS